MSRTAFTAATVLLALAGALGCTRNAPGGEPFLGKPSAPVKVEARLAEGRARVTVLFEARAKGVEVQVSGTDGLAVTSDPSPITGASFARGESASFEVAFTPGPGRSHLAVAVSGRFRGAGRRAAVASFAVGEPTPEQERAGGTVVEEPGGRKIRVVVPER